MSSENQPRKRFVGRKTGTAATSDLVAVGKPRSLNQIPDEILHNEELNRAIAFLPSNYNFEIHKTVWNIQKFSAKKVALQMPEGLLLYSCIISDILEQFTGVETLIMGDVTYGACCIDDFTARALGCDFLVHYAHSCLVPIDVTEMKVLYVFVTIDIDRQHLLNTLVEQFPAGSRLALTGTIQFNPTVHAIIPELAGVGIQATAPQAMPLSKGEVLGCTSARLSTQDYDATVYIGDGRFHLESSLIQNPELPAYKYDPYSRKLTIEEFDHRELYEVRRNAIQEARKAKKVGLILGSLGRQGNPNTLEMVEKGFKSKGVETILVLLSEIFPGKLAQFDDIDCWVQVACPRLSIDWGYAFPRPLLTPYEAMVSLGEDQEWNTTYPMDYYSMNGYGRGKKPVRAN
jgi:2-(3-amino-3-carboxypropyl)histidine synthase